MSQPDGDSTVYHTLRLWMVGDRGVGKTSLLLVAQGCPYPGDGTAAVLQNSARTVPSPRLPGQKYRLEFWESGNEIKAPEGSGVLILCFALDDPESLKSVRTRWPAVWSRRGRPKLLIGTKSDLWNRSAPGAISQADIDAAAEELRTGGVVEKIVCSAKNNENLCDFFRVALGAWESANIQICNVA
jgi:GTPase SAR1 family protein